MKLESKITAVMAAGALAFIAAAAGAQPATGQANTPSTQPGDTQQDTRALEQARLIAQIQQALNAKGFRVEEVNGRMGPSTQIALAQFQQSQGLPATGAPDDQTLIALGVQAQMGMGGSNAGSGTLGAQPAPRGSGNDPCPPGMGTPGSTTGGGNTRGSVSGSADANTGGSGTLSGSGSVGSSTLGSGTNSTLGGGTAGGGTLGSGTTGSSTLGSSGTLSNNTTGTTPGIDPCPPGSGTGSSTLGQPPVEGTPPGPNTGSSRDLSGSDPAGIRSGPEVGSPGATTGSGGIPAR